MALPKKKVSQRLKAISKRKFASPPPPPNSSAKSPTAQEAIKSFIEEFYEDELYEEIEKAPTIKPKKPLTIVNGFEGSYCSGPCKRFFTHSEPNMDNGTFVCYECKLDKKLKAENK